MKLVSVILLALVVCGSKADHSKEGFDLEAKKSNIRSVGEISLPRNAKLGAKTVAKRNLQQNKNKKVY